MTFSCLPHVGGLCLAGGKWRRDSRNLKNLSLSSNFLLLLIIRYTLYIIYGTEQRRLLSWQSGCSGRHRRKESSFRSFPPPRIAHSVDAPPGVHCVHGPRFLSRSHQRACHVAPDWASRVAASLHALRTVPGNLRSPTRKPPEPQPGNLRSPKETSGAPQNLLHKLIIVLRFNFLDFSYSISW
jgi:hypothetical protein